MLYEDAERAGGEDCCARERPSPGSFPPRVRRKALAQTDRAEEAYRLLTADGGLVVDDIREGEASLHALWEKLCAEGAAEGDELLYELDFAAL